MQHYTFLYIHTLEWVCACITCHQFPGQNESCKCWASNINCILVYEKKPPLPDHSFTHQAAFVMCFWGNYSISGFLIKFFLYTVTRGTIKERKSTCKAQRLRSFKDMKDIMDEWQRKRRTVGVSVGSPVKKWKWKCFSGFWRGSEHL